MLIQAVEQILHMPKRALQQVQPEDIVNALER